MSAEHDPNSPEIDNIQFLDEDTLLFAKDVVARALAHASQPTPELTEQIAQFQAVLENPDASPREKSMAYSGILGLWVQDKRPPHVLEEVLKELDLHGESQT